MKSVLELKRAKLEARYKKEIGDHMVVVPINEKDMTYTLKRLKIKTPISEIWNQHLKEPEYYHRDKTQEFTWGDYLTLAHVFHFSGETITELRRELCKFLAAHRHLFHQDVSLMYEKLRAALKEQQQKWNTECPYINWMPDYGGLMKEKQRNTEEVEWKKNNHMDNPMDSFPQEPDQSE